MATPVLHSIPNALVRNRQVAVDLESSDDHWQLSLEAAQEARRQAKLVEENSRITHEKMLAAQDATRNFEKARREHMAIQVHPPLDCSG